MPSTEFCFRQKHFIAFYRVYIFVNIFSGIPWSNKDGEYSEGVFFWYENNSLYTTLDFHMELDGDPDVFNEWLEQEKESPKYLQPTLQ